MLRGIRNRPLPSSSTVTTPDKKFRCSLRYSSLNSFSPEIFEKTFLNSTIGYMIKQGSKPRRITNSWLSPKGSWDLIRAGSTSLPLASSLLAYSLVKKVIDVVVAFLFLSARSHGLLISKHSKKLHFQPL